VTVPFDSIKNEFYELRDFILNDLDLLVWLPRGGNYAAALLIATACEAIGQLRYETGGGSKFFKNYLVPNDWRPVASSIFDALRNGLAHSFATKAILQIPEAPLELGISWKDKSHFTYDPNEGCVYINVADLSRALKHALEVYGKELQADPKLCDLFRKRRQRKRIVDVLDPAEREAWKRLLAT
jgi:hypothetical protein